MTLSSSKLKIAILSITAVAIIITAFLPPVPQDLSYHRFVDHRRWLSIPNYWNVFTNVGFLWIGVLGLYHLSITRQLKIVEGLALNYTIFFIGTGLVAFGSACYHWHPDNHTLIWDRLPMTIAFMGLLSIVLGEFLSFSWGSNSLWPLVLIGITSVCYWYWGELHGIGDLRLYILVQFLPMLILPIPLVFGKPSSDSNWGYWSLLAAYVLAKIAEFFDPVIYDLTHGLFAGHAVKHVLVTMGLYPFLLYLKKRTTGPRGC